RAAGVPGLSVERSPLSFFGGLRIESLGDAEVLLDDVVDPSIVAAGIRLPLLIESLRAGAAFATDQRSHTLEGGERAVSGGELSLSLSILDRSAFSLA